MNTYLLPLVKSVLPDFLRWYFVLRPAAIVRAYGAYAKAFASVFSFFYLLRTLFSPWKAIADVYPSKGLNLAEIGSVFALNMTARCIGAFIRLCTMVIGLLVEILCLAGFVAYLMAWVLLPVLLPVSIAYFLYALAI